MERASAFRARVEQRLAVEGRRLRSKARSLVKKDPLDGPFAKPGFYKRFLAQTNGRYDPYFPPEWLREDAPFVTTARVGVVMHVYYPELLPELLEHLRNIPVPFDVYVTNSSGVSLSRSKFLVGEAQHAVVLPVKNHGRDIAPLLYVVNAGYLDAYDLVLKVHTKRSPWREDHADLEGSGEEWRAEILGSLLGDKDRVEQILGAFASAPRLGAVGPDGSILGPEFWGGDRELVGELGKRLGLSFPYDSLEFISGSMYWVRGFLLQGLRGLCAHYYDFHPEQGQVDGTTAHAVERLVGLLTKEAGLTSTEVSQLPQPSLENAAVATWRRFSPDTELAAAARYIPFYLPQFHPSTVNDRWWGKGFTEWRNVSQARPVFRGHVQPLVPGELGFYDLRLDDVRRQQLGLEQYAGVAGLMYYYYWFSGERALNLPIERLHQQSNLDQPYCIMWANENWTRAWDGNEDDVLLSQRYDQVPAEEFISDVLEFLLDPRYMRVDGAVVLAVYRPGQIDNFKQVSESWRKAAREAGVGELFLLSVDVTKNFDGIESHLLGEHGLDGQLGFPPHGVEWPRATREEAVPDHQFRGHLISYKRMSLVAAAKALSLPKTDFPGVMVNFDNTARKKWKADVWYGSNPYTFSRWLRDATEAVYDRPPEKRLVFINAWNEWAESAVLEPTQRWGRTYLQAVRNVAFS